MDATLGDRFSGKVTVIVKTFRVENLGFDFQAMFQPLVEP
jgi:hypothetical protein